MKVNSRSEEKLKVRERNAESASVRHECHAIINSYTQNGVFEDRTEWFENCTLTIKEKEKHINSEIAAHDMH